MFVQIIAASNPCNGHLFK